MLLSLILYLTRNTSLLLVAYLYPLSIFVESLHATFYVLFKLYGKTIRDIFIHFSQIYVFEILFLIMHHIVLNTNKMKPLFYRDYL